MSISAIMGISLSGMQAQQTRLAATADNVANALTPGYDRLETSFTSRAQGGVSATVAPSGGPALDDMSNVDLASEMLSLVEAEIGFKANAAVWETGADIWDVLLSIKRD
ncbi:flagellar basal body protein [Allorhizobium sp. NPDC080224]|uniref:Flagellar basal body rod protein n=1 Tax=Rhizobium rosettiformans TaxID=1368430 RepID=A0ABX7F0N5_9HYPH|nr:flagellar basal body protein [Rhizobium rosettiformans]QRF52911.1 flagellar basal body rod protein [Rhizobium rosettiformans]